MPANKFPTDDRPRLDSFREPDRGTRLDATVQRHGLMPQLSGKANEVWVGTGEWVPLETAFGTLSLIAVADDSFYIYDDGDPTKIAYFQLDQLASGNNVFTFPATAAGTFAMVNLAQTFVKQQTFQPDTAVANIFKQSGAGAADFAQFQSAAGVALTNITSAGDIAGGLLVTDGLNLIANSFNTSAARIQLTNAPGIIFDVEAGSVDPISITLGLASGTFAGNALTLNLQDAGGNNSTIVVDNRGGSASPVPFTTYRATIGSTAHLYDWRSEAAAVMSYIDFDGSFHGPMSPTTLSVQDNLFSIFDDGDSTRIAKFQCSTIAAATTRTLTVPDASGLLPVIVVSYENTGVNASLTEDLLTVSTDQLLMVTTQLQSTTIDSSKTTINVQARYNFSDRTAARALFAGGPVSLKVAFSAINSHTEAVQFLYVAAGTTLQLNVDVVAVPNIGVAQYAIVSRVMRVT